jgi:hypothetical protein
MKFAQVIPLMLAVLLAHASAGKPGENAPPAQAAFLFEWIELGHRDANKLIRQHADQASGEKLREVLGRMIDEKTATLVQTAYLTTKYLQRAKTESVDEVIYPTEYDPPEIPQEVHQHTRPEQLVITPANPTAFDVRNVGTTVEIEPIISEDGKTISLELAPEIVKHLGDRSVSDPETLPDSLKVIKLPAFYVMKLQTILKLAANDYTLAGMFTPPGKTDRRILLIVRAKLPE